MLTSMISHLVIVPSDTRERRTTFFQGFSDFWYPDYIKVLRALIYFPHDIVDPFLSVDGYIVAKTLGSSLDIRFLRVDLLEAYMAISSDQNLVIWSTAIVADQVETVLDGLKQCPLHISTVRKNNATFIEDLDEGTVKKLILALICNYSHFNEEMLQLKISLEQLETPAVEESTIEAKGHNCTEPMLYVLSSCKRTLQVTPITPSDTIIEHIAGMVDLAKQIDQLRPSSIRNSPFRKNDVLIHCPSIYTFLYRADALIWKKVNRKLNNPKRNFLKGMVISNKGYGNSAVQLDPSNIFNPYEDPVLAPLMSDRQIELKLYTTAISLIATNQFIPAFRLPNAVMLHHAKLREIGALINSNEKNRRRTLNEKFLAYGVAVKENIGNALFLSALSEREKILFTCDLPIEWISIDLLPLMFSHEISRVPSTPGNVMVDTLLSCPKSSYLYSALCEILIVRSFEDDDPIKNHLTVGVLDHIAKNLLPGINIKIVDINSRQELIKSLNEFGGMMVIFDCHGNHGGESGTAWLHVGGEKLSIWHIYQEARVPPIVMLAACSTHPVEGSHASVANGLLESGVKSVIGTFAPVDSAHAAVFVMRLLERIANYLPIVLKHRPYTWREIVTGLLRMSYVRDVLESLRDDHGLINQDQYEKLHLAANLSINMHEDKAWFEKFKYSIGRALDMNEAEERSMWERNFQFLDTMLFVQLGRPENIVISLDN